MTDQIYIIDPSTKQPAIIKPVSFSDIGIRERYDLQPWIIEHPQMLMPPPKVLLMRRWVAAGMIRIAADRFCFVFYPIYRHTGSSIGAVKSQ